MKIVITSSLITMQNLVADSHTVCTRTGGPKFFGGKMELWTTQIGGVADTLDTCSSPTLPNQIWLLYVKPCECR